MASKLRPNMTPEELTAVRREAKRLKYLRNTGKPTVVYPWEADRARAKVRSYRARGMSLHAMEAAGVSTGSNLSYLLTDPGKRVHRDTYNRIMAMPFIEPVGRSSSRVLALGTQRRLQALWADGYPSKWLAAQLGMTRSNLMHLILHEEHVTYPRYIEVDQLYGKLAGADPEDHGITHWSRQCARSWARRRGYAPSHCWDDDTIDDPLGWPEWTGACGTPRGYRLHIDKEVRAGNVRHMRRVVDYAPLAVLAHPALNRRSRDGQLIWPSARRRFIASAAHSSADWQQAAQFACLNCCNAAVIHKNYPHLAEMMGVVELGGRGNGREAEWQY